VLSGAYAVLEGAPALVAAVDRYVVADSGAEPPLVTDEVAQAIAQGAIERAPGFDATALREKTPSGDRKLGLGSSAAIVAASIAAQWLTGDGGGEDFTRRVFLAALAAHRAAQPGGSGIDVAASCFGGVVRCQLAGDALEVTAASLPGDLHVTVYACPESASTQRMLAAVHAFRDHDNAGYQQVMTAIADGAKLAIEADSASSFVAAQRMQYLALSELGRAAGVAIVTDAVAALDEVARQHGGCVGPSGAGGGDVALRFGEQPPTKALSERAEQLGLVALDIRLAARGVHGVDGDA
jgi:phosphomevalonate kinase